MAYDPKICIKTIQEKVPGAVACEGINGYPYHCDTLYTASQYYHNYCVKSDLYAPIQLYYCKNLKGGAHIFDLPENILTRCDTANKASPGTYGLASCMCCCACMAGDTRIAMLDGDKAIRDIVEGEQVLAASVDGNGGIVWSGALVDFSKGSGDSGEQPLMIYMALGADGKQDFICTMDQPIMLADGKMTIASKLRPGQLLMGRDGQPVEAHLVSLGAYKGAVHHIGIGAPWKGSVDQHLLCAAGLVVGDWDLQMNFNDLPASLKEAHFDKLPLLGTPAYEKKHGASLQKSDVIFEFSAKGADVSGLTKPSTFKAYYSSTAPIPAHAQKLLTDEQANDLLANSEQTSFGNPVPMAIFNTVAAQMKGFFPDIDFYYDALAIEPNVYAFEAYGRKTVVMNGGFGRLQKFGYEGTFMAMAQGAARFSGVAPLNASGYVATGQADGLAYGVIGRMCWVGSGLLPYSLTALGEWEALFGLVDPAHAGGSDPVEDPSLECRLSNIRSAIGGGSLLECAGGEPRQMVALEQATPSLDGSGIDLVCNVPLDPTTANNPSFYTLGGSPQIKSAKLDGKGFIVHLGADLVAGEAYVLSAKNLVSVFGTGMDPDRSTVPVASLPVVGGKKKK